MAIEFKNTERGFARADFKDRYGDACSLQKSSLADDDCIWLGCDHETMHPTFGHGIGARMHLTREMAAELIPILQYFVDTGDLPTPTTQPPSLKVVP